MFSTDLEPDILVILKCTPVCSRPPLFSLLFLLLVHFIGRVHITVYRIGFQADTTSYPVSEYKHLSDAR